MVTLSHVQSSNAQIATTLPPGLVAVFVGATNGIGEYSLKEFARHAKKPRVYFVGRSQEAGDRIAGECRELNSEGEFIFIKADVSLLKNVDDVCRQLQRKEKTINLLFLTCGSALAHVGPEGLHIFMALAYYARARFIVNLLPLLRQAPSLRRVVTVMAAGHEGPIHTNDFQSRNIPWSRVRGHNVSMIDMMHEHMVDRAPEVSFVHDYPGPVKSGFGRETNGVLVRIAITAFKMVGPLIYIPSRESGERHLFFATSARYPPRAGAETKEAAGVPIPADMSVAGGTDGQKASGVYAVHWDGESAGAKSLKMLARLRNKDMVKQVWEHTISEFQRVTGSESLDQDE
ncbi:hypothetical protein FE257_003594 [Aspergillus nanangensis]|uniref:Short-chain dehydrogenases/reductase n=1 Tax=Aspergillus nanangensis TaxID=2582783 RepID=A0AAD4GXH7_ASPNN|nr:hypothetical protein FE257_003594 [Aspergillus nanangensis]